MPHVYRHIRLDTNMPFYIGMGFDDNLKRAYEKGFRRSESWNYIANNFGYEVDILFQDIPPDLAKEKEKEFIALYGRLDLGKGTLVNLTDGGDGIKGWKPNKETLVKMKEAAKVRGTWMLNTPEIIEKRANSMRGKKRTAEQREKLAAWQRGVKKPKEFVEKMRERMLLPENVEKSRNQPNCKKVICLNNGVVYRSAAEASRQLLVSRSAVSMCCLGTLKSVNKLNFQFYKNQE